MHIEPDTIKHWHDPLRAPTIKHNILSFGGKCSNFVYAIRDRYTSIVLG